MYKPITYLCTENDNKIVSIYNEDTGIFDELHIGNASLSSYEVIGFHDLQMALAQVGYSLYKDKSP